MPLLEEHGRQCLIRIEILWLLWWYSSQHSPPLVDVNNVDYDALIGNNHDHGHLLHDHSTCWRETICILSLIMMDVSTSGWFDLFLLILPWLFMIIDQCPRPSGHYHPVLVQCRRPRSTSPPPPVQCEHAIVCRSWCRAALAPGPDLGGQSVQCHPGRLLCDWDMLAGLDRKWPWHASFDHIWSIGSKE